MPGKKSDEKTSYVDEGVDVDIWTADDLHLSLVGYLMGGEERNKRQINEKAEEFLPWFFSLAGE